jgi:hypothetical protein
MKPASKILTVAFVLLILTGLVVTSINEVRASAARMSCQNNMKQIGIAVANYESANDHFPVGTIRDGDLPPEKRLSWFVEIKPYVESAPRLRVDRQKAWDDPVNYPPREDEVKEDKRGTGRLVPVGPMKVWMCPASPVVLDPDEVSPTHYVGITGVGRDAAELPLSDKRAGLFGYDRKVTMGDVKDGLESTAAVIEAIDGGPWTAGGRDTLRAVVPDGPPSFGDDGQFPSRHHEGHVPWSKKPAAHVLFLDGSVRLYSSATAPQVIEALATIAGGD